MINYKFSLDELQNESIDITNNICDINCDIIQYESLISIIPHIIETIPTKKSKKMTYEDYYMDSDDFWNNIKKKIIDLIEKIKKFWSDLLIVFKKEIIDIEQSWYENKKYKIIYAFKDALRGGESLNINISNYKVNNPIQELFADVLKVNQCLEKIYDLSYELMNRMMTQYSEASKEYVEDKDAKFSEAKNIVNKEFIDNSIKNLFDMLCKQCNISINNNSINLKEIHSIIFNKYIDSGIETDFKKLFPSNTELNLLYSNEICKSFLNTIDTMRYGSTACTSELKSIQSYMNEYSKNDFNKDYLNSIKIGSLHLLSLTLQISSTIGESYFNIFMKMRKDGKNILKEILKKYK